MRVTRQIKLDKNVDEALKEIAKNLHRSVPNLIETLAINYVEKTTENNVIYETRD